MQRACAWCGQPRRGLCFAWGVGPWARLLAGLLLGGGPKNGYFGFAASSQLYLSLSPLYLSLPRLYFGYISRHCYYGYLTAISRLSHGYPQQRHPPLLVITAPDAATAKRRQHCWRRVRSYNGAGNVRSDCTSRYAVEAGKNLEHYQKVVNYWSSAKCEKCNAATLEALGTASLVGGCALDLGCVATVGTRYRCAIVLRCSDVRWRY